MKQHKFKILHLFSGIGGAALGFQNASEEYKGIKGSYETIAGIDADIEACKDFEKITGAKGLCMDLFDRQQYIDFHGHQPPDDWEEVHPVDLRKAVKETPDIVFTSPPCKGFSGLLPNRSAKSKKYQALNRLTVRGIFLTIEAFKDNLPGIIMIENVPRITSRGEKLLSEIKAILSQYGYLFTEGNHDCGELGGLSQKRKRYLLIARHPQKVKPFVYEPFKTELKPVSHAIGPLPYPDDVERAGAMHRLPQLAWKTWVRLALIPAGKDWRALEEEFNYSPRAGAYRIVSWDQPSTTVTAATKGIGSSNGVSAISDPRLKINNNGKSNLYRVQKWEESANCITGAIGPSNGAACISDPRLGKRKKRYPGLYKIVKWDDPSSTVIGQTDIQCGALSVADSRVNCKPRSGTYGVLNWNEPAKTVTASSDIHAGTSAIADPRIPDENERCTPIIISLDGTWHRPLTTLELAVLQGFPTHYSDGSPFVLKGNNNAKWRERIGNAVPPAAAQAIGETILRALLPNLKGELVLGWTPIWVLPEGLNENKNDVRFKVRS